MQQRSNRDIVWHSGIPGEVAGVAGSVELRTESVAVDLQQGRNCLATEDQRDMVGKYGLDSSYWRDKCPGPDTLFFFP